MTTTRQLYVVATSPVLVASLVIAEAWGRGTTVIHVGDPVAVDAIGLPPGLTLYTMRVVFRSAA